MSILDKASLIQIPSGYKSTKLYSLRPINGDGDFTFSRSSSGTRVNSEGLIETMSTNVPRLDYSGGASCASLLLEPQRTNLIPYSESFDNAAWVKQSGITISDNDIISPDGTQNADKITTTNSSLFMYDVLSLTPSIEYTVSFFIKNDNSNKTRIWGAGEGSFDITWNGSQLVSINQGYFENFGNGWYKVSVTQTSQADGQYIVRIYPNVESVTTNSIYLWGFQVEQGSYATSYIPTSGSTVTRTADVCNNAGTSATFNSTEGVLFAEIAALADDSTQRFISLGDGTSNNRIILGYNNASNGIIFFIRVGGTLVANILTTINDIKNYNKLAVKWKENDFALWGNGVELGSDLSGVSFASGVLDNLNFLDADGTTEPFYGKVKQIQVYNTALTDAELITLTT